MAGEIIQDYPTSAEAIQHAGLDYEVSKEDMYTTAYNADGQRMDSTKRIKTHFATMRKDTGHVLESSEKIPDRTELGRLSFFDSIVGGTVSSMKPPGHWGTANVSLSPPSSRIISGWDGKDLIEQYVFLTTSHDGLGSITAAFTPVRIVCAKYPKRSHAAPQQFD